MRFVLTALFSVLVLSACAPSTSVTASGRLSPTSIVLPTTTPSVDSTATIEAIPDADIAASLPTVTYTSVPTFTPPPLPTLVSRENSTADQLTKPSPEGLLALMDVLNTQYGYFIRQYDEEGDLKFNFVLDELSDLFTVISAETEFYYPTGFPNPQVVWKYYPFTSHDAYPVFPSIYLDSLTDAVLDDMNRHPNHLKDSGVIDGKGYTVKVYQVELDRDPQPEWLVRMDWEEIAALSWLVLDQEPDRRYTKLNRSLPDIPWLIATSTVTIETLQDFTGDGLTDIISLKQGYFAGTDSYSFYIAKGTKDGFQELRSVNESISVTNYPADPPYTINVSSDSNWLTLTFSDPHRINWGCAWNTLISYRWPYGSEQSSTTGEEMPQTPECSLAQAVKLYDPVANSTAIRLLENAITQFDIEDEDQFGKSLFAHYRLAVLYALTSKDSLSRQHLQWFVDNLPKANKALKGHLTSLLGEPKINAITLCDLMYNASASEIPKSWENYIDATAALHAYPLSNEIYPPAICPLQEVITNKLNQVDLTVQPVSEKALADQGIPVSTIQTYQFTNQDHPASFILVGKKKPYVVGYVPALDGWGWKILEEFDATGASPQTFFKDVTGDGFPELAYFQKNKYSYCPENEQGYKVFLTTSAGTGFVSVTHQVCNPIDKTFDLANHISDENGDGVVDWVADQIRQYGDDSVLTAEREGLATWFTPGEIASLFPSEDINIDNERVDLIHELYESSNIPTARQELMSERNGLAPADAFGDWKWQKLTYLLAVSYEMEGQADKATEMFTSVLQSRNQTLWGNLAELHLSGK